MILAWLLICQLWWRPGQGIYHEPTASWIEGNVTKTDAYFGYSVTYVPSSKRLIISAPKSGESGQIYACNLSNSPETCEVLDSNIRRFDSRYNKSYWLGATVKAGPTYFVTCAPLKVLNKSFKINTRKMVLKTVNVGTFSQCFTYKDGEKNPTNLKTIADPDRLRHASLFEHTMDSFGWSIDVDDKDIIIGGPAMFTGRALKHTSVNSQNSYPISLTGFIEDNNAQNYKKRVDYNFGYSVAIGYFDGRKSYAVGSPYGKMGYGKVSFFKQLQFKDGSLDLQTSDEFAIGSMFGATLCAARLKPGSTATALLVGAPTYSPTQRYNLGAVYFYEPASKLPLSKEHFRKIVGTNDNGFFGSAIARLGDYNGDGLDEIAIAAPYEHDSTGAVYIYSSADIISSTGDIKWIQRVVPSPSLGIVRSFGLSLASVQDYDENGCNELAIGAPESNKVMLLKCIASVTVKHFTKIPEDLGLHKDNPFRTDDRFIFESCFEVMFPPKPQVVFARLKVNVSLDHPDTKLEKADKSYEVVLNSKEAITCRNITVLAPKSGNYQNPIGYRIKAVQVDPPDQQELFNPSHVALSDRSSLKSLDYIWLTECEDKKHCNPDLKLISFLPVDNPLVIGSMERMTLDLSVSNVGEPAYGACLRVLANGVHITGVSRGCERPRNSLNELMCKPPGALRKDDDPWNIPDILFDLSRLTSEDTSISISTALYKECNRADPEWKHKNITLMPDLSKISVTGITDSGVSNSVNVSYDDVDGRSFEHSYTISTGGLTNLVNFQVIVERPYRSFIEYSSIYISSDSQNEVCLEDATNETLFTCNINELSTKRSAKVIVPMKIINPDLLSDAITAKINSQYTSLTLMWGRDEKYHTSVTTTFNLGSHVNIWIIVVASLVGLLILLLIFFLLSKRGFFNRKNKTELENVRKSVRRQTMMRRTMVEGVRGSNEPDRRSLLATLSHETAAQALARDTRVRLDSNATKKPKK